MRRSDLSLRLSSGFVG